MTRLRSGALALLWTTAAWAGAADTVTTRDLRGTVGPYRIGCELVVSGDRTIDGGHSFYASRLTDIPLTGTIDRESVTLTESGGGVFHLHFVSNGSAAGQPLTFANSVALVGDWTGGGKTLPVRLDFDSAMDGPTPARRYAQVTDASDAAFEARVQGFVTAVLHDNKQAATARVSIPFRINGTPTRIIQSKRELLARWDEIFTPKLKAAVADSLPHDMFVHNGQAMIGNGVVWFDRTGAVSVNEP